MKEQLVSYETVKLAQDDNVQEYSFFIPKDLIIKTDKKNGLGN